MTKINAKEINKLERKRVASPLSIDPSPFCLSLVVFSAILCKPCPELISWNVKIEVVSKSAHIFVCLTPAIIKEH